MSAYTPGPWINRVGPSSDLIIESASNAFLPPMVAKVCGWHDSGHQLEALANARLIAAAPDMLAALYASEIALRSVLHSNVQIDAAFEQLRKAIAKAEGVQ